MDTQKYRILLKTIEEGSLSKTALQLDYSQSGITHMIHSMENEWGITLLHRTHAGVTLTQEGERLLPHMYDICNAENRLMEEINAIHGVESGRIRIGSFSSVSTHLLPKVMQKFSDLHPGIEFQIRQGDYPEIESWLLEGTIDIGFLKAPLLQKLNGFPLLSDRLLVVLPKNHPLASYDSIDPVQLEKEPFIMLEAGRQNIVEDFFRENGVAPQIRYWVKDDYTAMSMVENGLGISALHELVLQRNPYQIAIRDFSPPVYRKIMVAYQPQVAASSIAGKFLSFLKPQKDVEWAKEVGVNSPAKTDL